MPRGKQSKVQAKVTRGKEYIERLDFQLDPFQIEAISALDSNHSVLVSAPTGSGKTLIAFYAIDKSFANGTKAFYTTPLKALSNQKYEELSSIFGEANVGLLTGDTTIVPNAPIVVMTTEVLRNMLLGQSDSLVNLSTIVLDEVHYLQDPYRGGVWEEILILSPKDITFVCLSATVGNANELGRWLRSIRGELSVVIESNRPIALRQHFAIKRNYDNSTTLLPLVEDSGQPSREAIKVDHSTQRRVGYEDYPRGGTRAGYRVPRRYEVIEELITSELLPAIIFIFSRAGCDDAVRQVIQDGLRLTTKGERREISEIVERSIGDMDDEDLEVLGYSRWLHALENGVASHHAGLVPAYRKAVEECFSAGLLKVVFATETLSLGINMPARTVVIERLTKFNGKSKSPVTSGEYAQLTGRAGRRGLDNEGHAVVLWSPGAELSRIAKTVSAPIADLRSAFRPTYNLIVNLVSICDRDVAMEVLHKSFAQWQASAATDLVTLFNQRFSVLEQLEYVQGWKLTNSGQQLSSIYHDADLIVNEAMLIGALDDIDPALLAGIVASFVYQPRASRKPQPSRGKQYRRSPNTKSHGVATTKGVGRGYIGQKRKVEIAERMKIVRERCHTVRTLEKEHGVICSRVPDPGLSASVVAWASGAPFAKVLEIAEKDIGPVAPGDFVRLIKSVGDLVNQISITANNEKTRFCAIQARNSLMRGVVVSGSYLYAKSEDLSPSGYEL